MRTARIEVPLQRRAEAAAQQLAELRRAGDGAVLALVEAPKRAKYTSYVLPGAEVGLLNVSAYALLGMDRDDEAQEQFVRRLEKESVRLLADLIELEPCVFPLCGLYPTEGMEWLDKKVRGACPHCRVQAEPLLRKRGFRIDRKAFNGAPPGP